MDGLDGQVPAVLAREIYQIIREGLVNAGRHSHASVVQVDLQADDQSARNPFRQWPRLSLPRPL
jgi:signal transduction histidine kinase